MDSRCKPLCPSSRGAKHFGGTVNMWQIEGCARSRCAQLTPQLIDFHFSNVAYVKIKYYLIKITIRNPHYTLSGIPTVRNPHYPESPPEFHAVGIPFLHPWCPEYVTVPTVSNPHGSDLDYIAFTFVLYSFSFTANTV